MLEKSRKKEVLETKIQQYEIQFYDLELEYEIAEELEKSGRMDQVMEKLKELKKIIKKLEGKLAELEAEDKREAEGKDG